MKRPRSGSSVLDSELLWHFTESAGDLGIHAMPVEPSAGGGSVTDMEPSERVLRAAGRQRKVLSALHSLSREDQALLRLAHEPIPPGLRPQLAKLGELARVILWLRDAGEVLGLIAVAATRGGLNARLSLTELRGAAELRVSGALNRYRNARRVVDAMERKVSDVRHQALIRRLRGGG